MNVIDNTNVGVTTIKELDSGDVFKMFRNNDDVYMVCYHDKFGDSNRADIKPFLCIGLGDGVAHEFDGEEKVFPVKATVLVTDTESEDGDGEG